MDFERLEECRDHFPSLKRRRNGKPPIYFDSACTTLVPQQVIDAVTEYYADFPACGGRRSHHWFSEEVTNRIEGNHAIRGSRQQIAGFIHAASAKEIIFTLNTTHAINTVAAGYGFRPGDAVLLSDKEHNSNLLPWLKLQKAGKIRLEFAKADSEGRLDVDDFEQKLKRGGIRLVSMAFTSNLTGCTIPAAKVIQIAHQCGARVLLDAAQTAPHHAIDVQALDIDFLAFSLHKMCGPRGVGILYAKQELLGNKPDEEIFDVLEPVILGGGTVSDTTLDSYSLLAAPDRFEAGIQHYSGLIAAGAAVQYLQQLGLERIAAHERSLNQFLTEGLMSRFGDAGWLKIIGPKNAEQRGGILSFEVQRPNSIGIADALSKKNNIMIRDGVFCVHSYFNALFGQGWMRPKSHRDHRMIYRVSLYFYNTIEECRIFLDTLGEIFEERCYL
jgi:cysteine desulfurase / selenocysteine lyase